MLVMLMLLAAAETPRPFEPPADPEVLAFGGNPETGWNLFRAKQCINCHAIWGEGGDVGPDLGRVRVEGHLSAGQLAAAMWNHVPRMWNEMEERQIKMGAISSDEMSHLFAFLLFIRYVDEPGDPDAGELALRRFQCASCHAIAGEGGSVGPDLARWARYVNPVIWAQKMWAHAGEMEEHMAAMQIRWPKFAPGDLVDIIAYIRARGMGETKQYLEPGVPHRGRELFAARGCVSCHVRPRTAPDLDKAELPDTLAGIASSMWNHAPGMQRAMRRRGGEAAVLEAQEMADIIAYLLTRRHFLMQGDPAAGAKVFASKGCLTCHTMQDRGGRIGPELTEMRGRASPVFMAYVMWRYGPEMLAQMTRHGVPWPSLSPDEMSDLITFLNQE